MSVGVVLRRNMLAAFVLCLVGAGLPTAGVAEAASVPETGLVAFGAGPPRGLWAADVDKSSTVQLTASSLQFSFAQDWSPDGNEILYTRGLNGVNSLRITGLDGSNDRQIAPAGPVRGAAWAPDGQTVMYWTWENGPGGGSTVVLIDADGTGAREVAGLPNGLGFRLSPDGTKIAFEGFNYCWDLMVADINLADPTPTATNLRAVVEASPGDADCTAGISGISWTPDGQSLVYVDRVDTGEQPPWWDCGWITTENDIFKVDEDGSSRVRLTATDGVGWRNEFGPDVSPDGTMIAFASGAPVSCVGGQFVHDFDGSELFVMEISGSTERGPLTNFGLDYQTVGIHSGAGVRWQQCTVLTDVCSLPSFPDVGWSHPFFDEIEWMSQAGISTGYGDGTFRPGADVTRQAMSAFLYRLAGEPTVTGSCSEFSDVEASHPFCDAIAWMAQSGVSTGYGDGTFRPGADVTRQAMSAFLYRLAGEPTVTGSCSEFSDVEASHPFCDAIAWMAQSGVSTGYADGTFRPAAAVTRQAMAAFMSRFDEAGLLPVS